MQSTAQYHTIPSIYYMNKLNRSCCPLRIFGIPLLGKVIAISQMVEVPIDLQILPNNQMLWLNHLSIISLIRPSL